MAKNLAKQIVSGPQTQHIGLVLGGGGTDGYMNPPYLNLQHLVSTFCIYNIIYKCHLIQVINSVNLP